MDITKELYASLQWAREGLIIRQNRAREGYLADPKSTLLRCMEQRDVSGEL